MNKESWNTFAEQLAQLLEIPQQELMVAVPLCDYANWDSLTLVSISAMASEYFQVSLSWQEMAECQSFTQLQHMIVDAQAFCQGKVV